MHSTNPFFNWADMHQKQEESHKKENRNWAQARWVVLEGQGPGRAYDYSSAPVAERSNGMWSCREMFPLLVPKERRLLSKLS